MAWYETPAARALGVRYPLLQAPMSGSTTPELAAAVSNAGALGSLGAAWLAPADLRAAIRAVRQLTDRPFMVNLFAWPEPDAAPDAHPALDEQLAVVVEEQVPVFSFTFGIPDFAEVKSAGATIVGTATTVAEARALEAAGVDVVVAQGWEAGGHRGTFELPPAEVEVGSLVLVPQVVDAVSVPVLAAGGIMDGRGIAAALALGAGGASLGTAFLTASEAPPAAFRRLLARDARGGHAVSRGSSRAARRGSCAPTPSRSSSMRAEPPAPYPLQLDVTRPIHRAGLEADDSSRLFALAGQGAALVREAAAADLVETLVAETETSDLATRRGSERIASRRESAIPDSRADRRRTRVARQPLLRPQARRTTRPRRRRPWHRRRRPRRPTEPRRRRPRRRRPRRPSLRSSGSPSRCRGTRRRP